jgi:hypothetical protein
VKKRKKREKWAVVYYIALHPYFLSINRVLPEIWYNTGKKFGFLLIPVFCSRTIFTVSTAIFALDCADKLFH